MTQRRAVIIGDLEVARRVCRSLSAAGLVVTHLIQPTDDALAAALTADVESVAVLVRGDVTALRYSLLVEHLRPGVRLLVTLFDRTVTEQLVRTVPNCTVTSPADVAAPPVIAACLGISTESAVRGSGLGRRGPQRRLSDGLLRQCRPHDVNTRVLLTGLAGLLSTVTLDWFLGLLWLHQPAARALYSATRVIATVGPGDSGNAPAGYLVLSSVLMLLTIGFTALFTAGVVDRTLSSRSIGLIGARTLPRTRHVVVVGLGQVGLRVCMRLRQLGVPVVAVERNPDAANLRLAKAAGIPVLIAHGEDRAVLARLRLRHAVALAAMASQDLENVEVALAALVVSPELRIVLRAGDGDVITETRSLFKIGQVCDVSALTAAAVSDAMAPSEDAASSARDGWSGGSGWPDGTDHSDGAYRAEPPWRCACPDNAA